MSSIQNGFLFLINSVVNLYLFVLMLRLLLVYIGANYLDSLTQFVTRLTDLIVKPLRRLIPNVKRVELSTLVLMIVIELVKFYMIFLFMLINPNIIGLFILTIGDLLKIALDTFFYAIIAQVILSWIQPYSSINRVLIQITAPIMRPIQRIIPPISGIDISPIVAIIGLQFLNFVLAQSLIALGWGMAVG
jgi:YggT family protein